MRNFKRILALVIAVIMIAGTFATLSAAKAWYEDAVIYLENKGIATIGVNANKKISRNEFVFWVAKIESRQLIDSAWNDEIAGTEFSDVTDDHHKAAIAYAARRHFIEGNGDGTFSPDKVVTLAEASAVIVRLMGYAEKVAFSVGEEWKFNNMQVAQTYVKAFDAKFLANTKTYDPDYELSYGEAAYLLALLLNFDPSIPTESRIRTADRIDLGDALAGITGSTLTKGYYITKMDRGLYEPFTTKAFSTTDRRPAESSKRVLRDFATGVVGVTTTPIYTNLINSAEGSVVLKSIDGTDTITLSGAKFTEYLRKSLGLSASRNIGEEEPEINAYQYCDVGSLIYVTKNNGSVASISVSSSSMIVDTYLQAEYGVADEYSRGFGANYTNMLLEDDGTTREGLVIPPADVPMFVGWTIRELKNKADISTSTKNESMTPVLPISYTEDLAITWTNIVRNGSGTVTSATLNFQGVNYLYRGSDSDSIKVYKAGNMTTLMSPDWAVSNLISTAQGECLAVFNDVDGNGVYDNVVVKESDPFLYVGTPDVAGASTGKYDVYSSVSNGKVVISEQQMKGFNIGSVILDKTVAHPDVSKTIEEGPWDYRTDGYGLRKGAEDKTGKVQLVLRASNRHNLLDGNEKKVDVPMTPNRYTVVDLAEFSVGIIESVDAYAVKGYFKATIKNIDGTPKDVLIPEAPQAQAKFNVTVGGATAEYTFDSSSWLGFVTKAKDAIVAEGIVSGVEDPALRQATAAWMTGRYVQYADKDGKVLIIEATDSKTEVTGFVLGAEANKAAGENVFTVKLAQTGAGSVGLFDQVYLKAAQDPAYDNKWVVTNPVHARNDWFNGDAREVPISLMSDPTYWNTLYVFRGNTNYKSAYGYSGAAYLITAQSSTTVTPSSSDDWTPKTLVPILNNGIHDALNDRAQSDTNAWTVDAEGFVHDQTGAKVYFKQKAMSRLGAEALWEEDVRGSASAIFDWENYAVYSQIFDKGLLINPTAEAAAKVGTTVVKGTDLIYVTVYEDAGSVYLKKGDTSFGDTAGKWIQTVGTNKVDPAKNLYAFYPRNCVPLAVVTLEAFMAETAEQSWLQVEGWIQIGDVIEQSKSVAADKSYYDAEYDFVEGINPYYSRTWNATKKVFEYTLRFETVNERTGVTGHADAIVDETKTLLIPLMIKDSDGNTVQVKLTDSNKASYQAKIDAGIYYVDSKTKNIFKVESDTIYYMTDKDGNVMYHDVELDTGATSITATYTDLHEKTQLEYWEKDGKKVLSKYDTLGFKEAPKSTPGWFPGLYTFTFEGRTLQIPFYSKVVILTPSANGFTATEMTVEKAATTGIFAVAANFVEDDGKVGLITVIGEPAGAFDEAATPETPSSTEPDKNLLVYLSTDSTTVTQSTQFGKKWIVMTNGSAYAIPSGENVGNIYREYNTYEETKAGKIELDVVGGHWYKVNKDGKILDDATDVVYETITAIDLTDKVLTSGAVKIGDATEDTDVLYLGTLADASFIGYYESDGARTFVKYDVGTSKYVVDEDGAFADAAYKLVDTSAEIGDYYTNVVDGTKFIKNGDVFYAADENFLRTEISAYLKGVKTATVVSATAAGGTKIAFTSDLTKAVDASDEDFEFFYRNADKTVLYKAGDSTTVTIATPAAYAAAIKTQQEAYDKSKAAYDNAVAKGYLSKSRLAYYENDFNEKAAALAEKKDSLLDTYYNGQFWNVPNSPFMKYQVKSQQTYQSAEAKLTFNYIVINGVYCVFSDEFVLN